MLKKIILQNFRNYDYLELNLSRGNIFIGDNAQGKTNLLEAVNFLSNTKSFRTSKDQNAIKEGESFFSILGSLDSGIEIKIISEKVFENIRKTVKRKDIKVSLKSIIGEFISVIFSPEDISFFTDSSQKRRRYLDIVLCQVDKIYLENLIKYKKTLEQRNAFLKALKEGRGNIQELRVWDESLAEYGIYLIEKRDELITFINQNISYFYSKLSLKDELVEIKYISNVISKNIFLENLEFKLNYDISSGVTSIGPHRDDIIFLKDGKEINIFSSRGELRSVILALKFCEGKYFEEIKEEKATYLLDDVFSELDKTRRNCLFSLLKENQFLITTTDIDHIGKNLLDISEVYIVENGRIIVHQLERSS